MPAQRRGLHSRTFLYRILCQVSFVASDGHFFAIMNETDARSKHRSDSLLQPYLDGIVSMQIRNLNSLLESARTAILEKYHPKEEHPIDLKGRPN